MVQLSPDAYVPFKEFEQVYRALGPYHQTAQGFTKWFLARNYQMLARGLKGSADILDIGCGEGTLEMLLAQEHSRIIGLDLSPTALHLASISSNQHTFVLADMQQLPFQANTFDAVVSSLTLQYLGANNWSPFLYEIRRVLRPNGRLVFSHINPRHYNVADSELESIGVIGHRKIRQLLHDYGFCDIKIRGTNIPLKTAGRIPDWFSVPLRTLAGFVGYYCTSRAYHFVVYAQKGIT